MLSVVQNPLYAIDWIDSILPVEYNNQSNIYYFNIDYNHVPLIERIPKIKDYLANIRNNKSRHVKVIINGLSESADHAEFFYKVNQKDLDFALKGNTSKLYFVSSNFYQSTNMIGKNVIHPVYFSSWLINLVEQEKAKPMAKFTNPKKDFICLNRRARRHRTNLVHRLHEKSLIKNNYVSYFFDDEQAVSEDYKPFKALKEHYESNITIDMKNSKSNPASNLLWDCYRDSFFSLVTETYFYESRSFLSEKTFKPIAARQPFVLMAPPFYLEALRETGIKTFGEYFDESYDLIEDHELRMNAIVALVDDICKMPYQKKLNMFAKMKDICEHNYNVVFADNTKYLRSLGNFYTTLENLE